jgi:hypothetical protein
MISFGYQCGTLPTTLQVKGLHCPRIGEHCWRACECWPVKSVVDFEHDGSSSLLTRVGKFHSLDVCVGRNEIVSLLCIASEELCIYLCIKLWISILPVCLYPCRLNFSKRDLEELKRFLHQILLIKSYVAATVLLLVLMSTRTYGLLQ